MVSHGARVTISPRVFPSCGTSPMFASTMRRSTSGAARPATARRSTCASGSSDNCFVVICTPDSIGQDSDCP